MGGAKKLIKKVTKSVSKVAKNPVAKLINPINAIPLSKLEREKTTGGYGGSVSAADIEKRAGVTAPSYESLRDPATGQLRAEFAYDPSKSAAFSELQKQAMSAPGESPWAKMQMQKQAFEEQGLMDQTAAAQAQGLAQAQGQLMRQGGLSSGARTRLAMQGAKDMMLAQQGARRSGIEQRLGIGESDINRQADLLGRVSSTELEGQGKNLASLQGDVQAKRDFDLGRYQSQMAAYGANKTADAQVSAAKKSRKK